MPLSESRRARSASEPTRQGGFYPGAKACAEREATQRAAGAIGLNLKRIGVAVAERSGAELLTGVDAQCAADATSIPRLSAIAEAINTVATVTEEKA